tara:strand:- start:120 stop:1745 length:1626 start_codon:yes stop_codon:yes gene_type:complete
MKNSFIKSPRVENEEVLLYSPGSKEKDDVLKTYKSLYETKTDIKLKINGKEVDTKEKNKMYPPHEHNHNLGTYSVTDRGHVNLAIKSALNAKEKWNNLGFSERASIFLKAAELICGPYRKIINASTMIAQSKTIHQAEIDAACEFADFLRFNVKFAEEIYNEQPISSDQTWNKLSYRPLEGFVYAISPFNFTAIGGNLCAAPALMGNTIVWKPSDYQVFSAKVTMDIFEEAGLPDGVINMIFGDPEMITNQILSSSEFAGIHFTGSTSVFKNIWKKIGNNIDLYKNYPRIVGETGGKDFIMVHPSANVKEVSTAVIRGAFEFQGQKCSAASRVYLPKSIGNQVLETIGKKLGEIKIGPPSDFQNFITAVIHKDAFERLKNTIQEAKSSTEVEVLYGGKCDDSVGYFVEPTVLVTKDPKYITMEKELFGPIVTVYIYDDKDYSEVLKLVDNTSEYALTGAIFAKDRYAIKEALDRLENSAGNFYINDKPSGAVVGQQPFGGARASGTNDKAGSKLNLLRWVSPRLIKEPLLTPKDYKYPFLG